jgi:hypothetical protein
MLRPVVAHPELARRRMPTFVLAVVRDFMVCLPEGRMPPLIPSYPGELADPLVLPDLINSGREFDNSRSEFD